MPTSSSTALRTVGRGWSHASCVVLGWVLRLSGPQLLTHRRGIRILPSQGAYEAQISFTISGKHLVPGVQWSTVLAIIIVAFVVLLVCFWPHCSACSF